MAIRVCDNDGLRVAGVFSNWLFPRVTRSIHEFAEQEVILPKGPRKGLPFSIAYMPFTRFIFDAIEDPRWNRVAVVGPTQSGKSLVANNIPMLYFLFEQEEDIIVGIPHMDLARGIWQEKILPVILATRYRELLPTVGAGARGGTPTAIQLKNGVWLRFMGAGGGDAQRSSHTARVIIVTEVDKLDDVGDASEEADPVSQIEMRSDAFENSKIILECTVTSEYGRIWQEAMIQGSGGQVFVPCPACGHFQTLRPEGLVFDETDAIKAEESARYRCEKCEKLWDDGAKRQALQRPVLAHKGQTVDEKGVVSGLLPQTRTFGLHYNILYSPMKSLGFVAAQQWEASHSELTEKKKAMQQSKWALPWKEEEEVRELSLTYLRARAAASEARLRQVPDWTDWLIMTVDVQKLWLYWHCEVYRRDTSSQVVEYGVVDIHGESDYALKKALDEVAGIAADGWPASGPSGEVLHKPRLVMVDVGYRTDVILPWLKNRSGWVAARGVGREQKNRMTGQSSFEIPGILQVRRQPDGAFIWFVFVDQAKAIVHDRYFITDATAPGYTEVPQDATMGYLASIAAEKRVYEPDGERFKWEKVRRRNDYLDCRAYGVAGAMYLARRQEREQATQEQQVLSNEQRQRKVGAASQNNYINSRGRFFN